MSTITPYQLDIYSSQITDIYRALELEIFKQVCNRLKLTTNVNKDNVLKWQISKMNELHLLNNSTIEALSKANGIASSKIKEVIKKAGYDTIDGLDNDISWYADKLPYPSQIGSILQSYINQTFIELDNLVNQTLISTQYGTGSIMRMYQSIIEETTAKVLSGMTTIDKALEETIQKWANKGVESGFVDKGGHTWSLERYVDTVLRSTVNRTYNDLRTARMSEYDVYTVLVSSHSDARPACARCQGQVLDIRPQGENVSGYPSVYEFDYKRPAGHRGINCKHMWFPFIPGASTNNQPQFDAQKAIDRAKIVAGQREIERRIRKTKKNLVVAEALGSESVSRYKDLLRRQQAQMREYVKENDLTRQYKREKVVTPKEILMKG